jgi:hypothetical protein
MKLLIWLLSLSLFSGLCFANWETIEAEWKSRLTTESSSSSTGDFLFDEEDLQENYGQYTEASVELAFPDGSPVGWQAWDLPPGFELEDSTSASVLLFGTPKFTGSWCFTLGATQNQRQMAVEICFSSLDDPSKAIPRFSKNSQLSDAVENETYQERIFITVSEGATYAGQVLNENKLPQGLQVLQREANAYFSVKGKFPEPGIARFAIYLRDTFGSEHYRQFQISVEEKSRFGLLRARWNRILPPRNLL